MIRVLLAGLFLVGATVFVSREVWHHPSLHHIPSREVIIGQHLSQLEGAVILGDSLVERSAIRDLCGLPVINAGIGRAKTADLMNVAAMTRHAPLKVLAVGVNDNLAGYSVKHFSSDYRALVSAFEPHIVVGITGPDRDAYNEVIRQSGAVYVEPLSGSQLYDGVHYKSAEDWNVRLRGGCG